MHNYERLKSPNDAVTFCCVRSEAVCYYWNIPFLGFERHILWWEGKQRKITYFLESVKLCQRLTTSVMTESDILRRPMLQMEGIPERITKPSTFS